MPSSKVLFACVVLFIASTYAQDFHAIVYLQATSNSPHAISGSVTFIQQGTGIVTVTAEIDGLPDGDYAMHVNEYGDLSDISGFTAGPIFAGSQVNTTHGCPPSDARLEGDMGSWTSVDGTIFQQKQLNLLQLSGEFSIIGRAVVLHELSDSCSGEAGNAGVRYAFGVIGIHNYHSSQANQEFNAPLLVCNLEGTSNCPGCHGTVWFEEGGDSIRVTGEFFGLAFGTVHAIHVHQYGDLTNSDGTSLGGHWNPEGNVHGLPEARPPPHEGDMGNVQNYDDLGTAWYKYDNELISSLANITGRGVVLHELPDHGRGYACDPNGSAGTRFATCVIGIASNFTVPHDVPIRINNNWADIDCEEPPVYSSNETTILTFASHFTSELYVFTSTSSSAVLCASVVLISFALMLFV